MGWDVRMSMVTLTTNFGLADGYAGIMHGVIRPICPDVQIVDLTHLLPPQDASAAACLLVTACPYFPPGAIRCVLARGVPLAELGDPVADLVALLLPGELLALIGSAGYQEIAVAGFSAAVELGLGPGAGVILEGQRS